MRNLANIPAYAALNNHAFFQKKNKNSFVPQVEILVSKLPVASTT